MGLCSHQINIVGLQILQADINGHVHALGPSPAKVALLYWLAHHRVQGVLGGDDHRGAAAILFHPLADPLLALPELVNIGRIDEVTAQVIVRVKELERRLLGTFAHHLLPIGAQTLHTVSYTLHIRSENGVTYSCRPVTTG